MARKGLLNPIGEGWNTGEIESNITDPNLKKLMLSMYAKLTQRDTILSSTASGVYSSDVSLSGYKMFPKSTSGSITPYIDLSGNVITSKTTAYRQELWKVVNFNSILNGVTAINHNIDVTGSYIATCINGAATSPTATIRFIPLPYVSTTGDNISVGITNTQVILTTTSANYISYFGQIIFKFLIN